MPRACMNGPVRFGKPARRSMKSPESGSERKWGIEQIEQSGNIRPEQGRTH